MSVMRPAVCNTADCQAQLGRLHFSFSLFSTWPPGIAAFRGGRLQHGCRRRCGGLTARLGLGLQGVHASQHDAWDLGVTTSDNFGNADVDYAATLPAVRASLLRGPGEPPCVPVVTGFLGRGRSTGGRRLSRASVGAGGLQGKIRPAVTLPTSQQRLRRVTPRAL